MNNSWGKAAVAGLVGTAPMTLVGVWAAPMMGMDLFAGA